MFTLKEVIVIIFITVLVVLAAGNLVGCCDTTRYELARNHLTGEVCYVYDWQTGEELPPTVENTIKAKGQQFWADPATCY